MEYERNYHANTLSSISLWKSRLSYAAVFSSPTTLFKWGPSHEHGHNIFSTAEFHVTSILGTCRRIYTEAASYFYADTYIIPDSGEDPVDGIVAFVEKIGAHNIALITDIAIYSGTHGLLR